MIPLLLYKIAQLFAVMIIGFALVKMRVVKSEHSVVLSRLALYLFMPAAILNSFNVKLTSEILGVERPYFDIHLLFKRNIDLDALESIWAKRSKFSPTKFIPPSCHLAVINLKRQVFRLFHNNVIISHFC